jgi:hypothetical protein
VQEETANWIIVIRREAYAAVPLGRSAQAVWHVLEKAGTALSTREITNSIAQSASDVERSVIRKAISRMYQSGQLLGVHSADRPTKWMLIGTQPSWSAEFVIIETVRALTAAESLRR